MNSVKIFTLAPGSASNDLWVGSPWSIDNNTPENTKFVAAYKAKYNTAPDQFSAQSYDAMHIAAQALKKVTLTGNLAADRVALRDALPKVKWTGATGAFEFTQAKNKAGKPAGYDAKQTAIISVTHDGKYTIEK
jgi:branched-chain amino acid transport system substrate-binding protein